jgi:formylglycine-generating enzyme required for sulfatase activity
VPPLKLFISYRRKTWPFAHRLAERIREHAGWEVFIDFEGVSESNFEQAILNGVRTSDCFLLVVSEQTFDPARIRRKGDWVRREIREALWASRPIVLALVDGTTPPLARDLPQDIADITKRQGIEFYPAYFDAGVDRLVAFIDKIAGPQMALPWPARPESIAERIPEPSGWVEPEMVLVPPGAFIMGSPASESLAQPNEKPQHQLQIPYPYWIGKYPVMVGEYRAFIEAGGYRERHLWTTQGWLWQLRRNVEAPKYWGAGQWSGNDRLPVVGVSWHEAIAYCRWLSVITGRKYALSSEAEWEKAARGGVTLPDGRPNPNPGRLWPWGDEPPVSSSANFGEDVRGTTAVGAYSPSGDSPYGCADMAGNVWEWTRSLKRAYPYRLSDGREDEENPGMRVLRGGSWCVDYRSLRCARRLNYKPAHCSTGRGFRCIRVEG